MSISLDIFVSVMFYEFLVKLVFNIWVAILGEVC